MNIPEINPQNVQESSYRLIDVRSPEEFSGELSHVPGSELITLGEELDKALSTLDKGEKIIFICRSGNRSGKATTAALENGFKNVLNMKGGMLLWNELGLEVEK
jgi:hydroxyacylglutathione hydrolase